jgi:hypothetical protein
MKKFVSLTKGLKNNWSLSINLQHRYFEIVNKKTGKPVGLTEAQKDKYIHTYTALVEELKTYMATRIHDVDAWHYNREYERRCSRLTLQILLLAYQDDLLHTWGGRRKCAGRPATGRKRRQYYLDDEEDKQIKQYIVELRKPSK